MYDAKVFPFYVANPKPRTTATTEKNIKYKNGLYLHFSMGVSVKKFCFICLEKTVTFMEHEEEMSLTKYNKQFTN